MPVQTLHCPTCGAAVSSDSTQCQYCGARLQTVSCPSCFGLAFVGSKFCPHCGKELAVPADVQTHLPCPRCRTGTMAVLTLKETRLLECSRCAGLWLPLATFEHICNNQEQQVAVLQFDLPQPQVTDIDITPRYLPCPQCGQLMNRYNFAHHSGVIIDICKPHGVWFDRDELRKIIEFIRSGGMERAARIEQEELADQVRALEGLGNRLAPSSVFQEVHQDEFASAIASTRDAIGRFFHF